MISSIFKTSFHLLLTTLLFHSGYSQLTETYEIQDFSPESISKNHIRKVIGWEYQPVKEHSKIVVKTKQSYRLFDRRGRLLEQEYYYVGNLSRKFKYDSLGRLTKMEQALSDTLELTEYYKYDSLSKLVSWKVNFAEGDGSYDFEKTFEYDEFNNPVLQIISLKDRKRVDTLINTYDENNELKQTLKFSDTTSVPDSVIYFRNSGDTIWTKKYYENSVVVYIQSYIKEGTNRVYRTTDYKKGKLHKINYHKYDQYGNILMNRTFHHYVQGNFKKVYTYNEKLFPVKKEVFRNKKEAETVIKYEYGYY